MMRNAISLLLLFCAAANAQDFSRMPPPMISGKGANFTLICLHPVVIRELELDEKQVAALRKIVETLRKNPRFHPRNGEDVDEQRMKFLQQQQERRQQIERLDKQTEKLLTDKQRIRAKQLLFQYNVQTRRVEAALQSIGETVTLEQRNELEAMLSTVPVAVAAKFAEFNYRMVAKTVDKQTPETPSKQLMGPMFQFIDRGDLAVDFERHKITNDPKRDRKTKERPPR